MEGLRKVGVSRQERRGAVGRAGLVLPCSFFYGERSIQQNKVGRVEIKAVGFLPLCSMKLGDSLPPEAARAK